MQGVIYARYSSHNQTEQSIEGQLRECSRFAADNNIGIVNHYIDRAKTGTNDNRAEFQKMLRDSDKKQFDTVIVWKIDRFGRNREEIAINKVKLRKNNVRVMYAQENIPDSPEGIIVESCLEGFAEYYSKVLSQNIMRGMQTAALKGHYTGAGVALGYGIAEDKSFYVKDADAVIVKNIFDMYDSGKTQAEIIRELKKSGYKTQKGCDFNSSAITRIIKNRKYIGEYRWHDIFIEDGMPQIIDKEIFERCQGRMERNKSGPQKKYRENSENFMLTGKLYCGLCGDGMCGDSGTGKKGYTYYYYTCSGKKHLKGCKKKSVPKDFLEKSVIATTISIVLQDNVIDYIAKRAVELQKKERADKSELNYHKNQLQETKTAINNIMKAMEQGIITSTTKDRLLELEAAKRELETNIAMDEMARPLIGYDHIVYFLESFKNGDIEDKVYCQKIIDVFVNAIYLYEDKITITYNYSGDNNKITKKLIEETSDSAGLCSDSGVPSPPSKAIKCKNFMAFCV
ncbi:MAG: recombinase family protein, partial [Clostridiales bacterium]